MAKYTPYALSALPTTGIDVNGLYLIAASADQFNIYVRNNANSAWLNLGIVNAVTGVNAFTGAVQLDLSFSGGTLNITGGAVPINLDARYRQSSDNVDWSDINSPPDFALDSEVVHNSDKGAAGGVATLDGTGKVTASQLPSYVSAISNADTLADFPATGDAEVIYVADDTGKTYRWSGSIYIEISPSEVNSVFGRSGNVTAGGDDYAAFYARIDVTQSLTSTQKTQGRSNIGAADDSAVVHTSGAETVGGIKTFSAIPVLPASDPSTDNQAARKVYVDTAIDAAVSWGGTSGKEW